MQPWQVNPQVTTEELIRVGPKHVKLFRELWLNNGWHCGICGKPFTSTDVAVVDHCHKTGIIRGCLHNTCNRVEGELLGLAKRISKNDPENWVMNVCLAVMQGKTAGKNVIRIARWGHKGVAVNEYLVGLHNYLTWYSVRRTRMIHPKHKFQNEGGNSGYNKHTKASLVRKRRRRR